MPVSEAMLFEVNPKNFTDKIIKTIATKDKNNNNLPEIREEDRWVLMDPFSMY